MKTIAMAALLSLSTLSMAEEPKRNLWEDLKSGDFLTHMGDSIMSGEFFDREYRTDLSDMARLEREKTRKLLNRKKSELLNNVVFASERMRKECMQNSEVYTNLTTSAELSLVVAQTGGKDILTFNQVSAFAEKASKISKEVRDQAPLGLADYRCIDSIADYNENVQREVERISEDLKIYITVKKGYKSTVEKRLLAKEAIENAAQAVADGTVDTYNWTKEEAFKALGALASMVSSEE